MTCTEEQAQECILESSVTPSVFHVAWALLLRDYTADENVAFLVNTSTIKDHTKLCSSQNKIFRISIYNDDQIADLVSQLETQSENADIQDEADVFSALPTAIRLSYSTDRLQSLAADKVIKRSTESNHESSKHYTNGHPIDVELNDATISHNSLDHNLLESATSVKKSLALKVIIQCSLDRDGRVFSFSLESRDGPPLSRIKAQLHFILQQLASSHPKSSSIAQIMKLSHSDLHDIARWNCSLPESIETCFTDAFAYWVRKQPSSVAIHAWDVSFTYKELDDLSTTLAALLLDLGVSKGMTLPLCFEKCAWTSVAALAVIKTGAAFVLLDIDMPDQRLIDLIKLACSSTAAITLASIKQVERLRSLGVLAIHVSSQSLRDPRKIRPGTVQISPADVLYNCFTSGTTGVPKLLMISHRNLMTALHYQAAELGGEFPSRILDVSSYAFDVSVWSFALALSTGSCLCVPSAWEIKNNLLGAFDRFEATYVDLTPSVASTLDPKRVPKLKRIVLGGESASHSLLQKWQNIETVLINGYGPAECTVSCVFHTQFKTARGPSHIGHPLGAVTWVVDRFDYRRLLPIGSVGELVIEGPLVGLGYRGNSTKRSDSILTEAEWIPQELHRLISADRGPFYRTGDLVRYEEDGSLTYMGRADSQVKLRGQRIELEEIKFHLDQILPASMNPTPEIVNFQNGSELLVVFMVTSSKHELSKIPISAFQKLANILPPAMVPSAYINVNAIPLTLTGKTDRKSLKRLALHMTVTDAFQPICNEEEFITKETTDPFVGDIDAKTNDCVQDQLKQIWSTLLSIPSSEIQQHSNFLMLGGESLMSLRLVNMARTVGLRLTVADVFKFPTLYAMAERCERRHGHDETLLEPFSLVSTAKSLELLLTEIADVCGVQKNLIDDAYPCTPLQEGLMASLESGRSTYTGRQTFRLPDLIDLDRFHMAWQHVCSRHSILRTRIVDTESGGLLQVVLHPSQQNWSITDNLASYIAQDEADVMGIAKPLSRFGIVKEADANYFVLTLHHSVYDGWTLPRIGQELVRAYHGVRLEIPVGFNAFLRCLINQPDELTKTYWQKHLSRSDETSIYPPLPYPAYQPTANRSYTHRISLSGHRHIGVAMPSIMRAAWILLQWKLTGNNDVTFGTTTSGRNVPLSGIEDLLAPTITTVPVRTVVDSSMTVGQFTKAVQDQAAACMPFENYGLQNIRRLSSEAGLACDFQTLFIVHTSDTPMQDNLPESRAEQALRDLFSNMDVSKELADFNTYALMCMIAQDEDDALLEISYDSEVLSDIQTHNLAFQYEHILQQICKPELSTHRLETMGYLGSHDRDQIYQWNAHIPLPVSKRIDHQISVTASSRPCAAAICSWDGMLTYHDLEVYSNRLAISLKQLDVTSQSIIPICIQKSKWTTVAMVGILKAGCSFVAIDISRQSGQRLQSIIYQVGCSLIVTCSKSRSSVEDLNKPLFLIDRDLPEADYAPHLDRSKDGMTNATDTAFLVFTSGTTGVPKGIIHTHETWMSATMAHIDSLLLKPDTRVFDYASYSFDIGIHNSLATLVAGGCLCIPSEYEKENDLAGSMQRMEVNWADLTPSVARLIKPTDVPTLKTLVLAGEAISKDIVELWADAVNLVGAYGPAEAQICAINQSMESPSESLNIGRAVGCLSWIIDLESQNLAPIGAIGELVIEGPLVSPGYLHPSIEQTASWIESPTWIVEDGLERRRTAGRLYRTGDLVRYNHNGTMTYIGRANSQVKVNGQRVELGDIEYHIRASVPEAQQVVVELVHVEEKQYLFAFILLKRRPRVENKSEVSQSSVEHFEGLDIGRFTMTSQDLKKLQDRLPRYMIPHVYLTVSHIPLAATSKADRKLLNRAARSLPLENVLQLESHDGDNHSSDKTNPQIRNLWAQVLNIDEIRLRNDSDFFQLGGDSVVAMKLVQAARRRNISITVKNIFQNSRLLELSKLITKSTKTAMKDVLVPESNTIAQFSLLAPGVSKFDTAKIAATACNIDVGCVRDVYPATPFQAGLIALTLRSPNAYIYHLAFDIDHEIDTQQLRQAWQKTIASNDILRTRLVYVDGHGVLQVVLAEESNWVIATDISTHLSTFSGTLNNWGTPLHQLAIIESTKPQDRRKLVWSIHHALYDQHSLEMILDQVTRNYHNLRTEPCAGYKQYVKYIKDQAKESAMFWQSYLKGATHGAQFPSILAAKRDLKPDAQVDIDLLLPTCLPPGLTMASLIRCAWALIAARVTGSDRVIFGENLLGRNIDVDGIETLCGPTTATVPVMVKIDSDANVGELLKSVQNDVLSMQPFVQYGLQNISKLNNDTNAACEFQTLLVIQPKPKSISNKDLPGKTVLQHEREISKLADFSSYALLLYITPMSDRTLLEASFDSSVLSKDTMRSLLTQFQAILTAISTMPSSSPVSDVDNVQRQDLEQIWEWNKMAPTAVDEFVHDLISEQARRTPERLAVIAHDGQLTYAELEHLSDFLAAQLVTHGVGLGDLVPLCFEKSVWVPVAMMGVNKSGATFVLMDATHPKERLRVIAGQVSAKHILCSNKTHQLARDLVASVQVINYTTLTELSAKDPSQQVQSLRNHQAELPHDTSRLIYVAFTSGSSGKAPKGVMVSHQNIASAVVNQARPLGFDQNSRVFDYSSYSFDATIWHTFLALTTGGCLCTPSDHDRLENIEEAVTSFQSNIGFLTPSVARTLDPRRLPTLKKLYLGGEAVTPLDLALWTDHLELLGSYGPTEVTPLCIYNLELGKKRVASNIGYGIGVVTWLTKPDDYNRLVAIGAVGELVVEGPLVTQGYRGQPEVTAAAFIQDPDFLIKGTEKGAGRSGRLYRTGDLARYRSDGSIEYIGRGDVQVKLRGQRIDLHDVAYHVHQAIPGVADVIAEVVTPGPGRQILMAFLHFATEAKAFSIGDTKRKLGELLPRYMIPQVFAPLDKIPVSVAGKVNRLELRRIGIDILSQGETSEDYGQDKSIDLLHGPLTEMETKLRMLWSKVIDQKEHVINGNSDFFQIGGESIAAMRLSAIVQQHSLRLPVVQIMKHTTLQQMALAMSRPAQYSEESVQPFALVKAVDIERLRLEAVQQCEISNDMIEDIYPCTPSQSGMFALTMRHCSAYVRRAVYELPISVDIDKVVQAWYQLFEIHAILRTRIIQIAEIGLLQVVVREQPHWSDLESIEIMSHRNSSDYFHMGSRLSYWDKIVRGDKRLIVWTAHHALYDSVACQILDDQLRKLYNSEQIPKTPSFNNYVNFLVNQDPKQAKTFWKDFLVQARSSTRYPVLPQTDYQAQPKNIYTHRFDPIPDSDMKVQTVVYTAWALAVAQTTGSEDVTFGATLSGRSISMNDIETLVGPTMTTVPIRITLERYKTVAEIVSATDQALTEVMKFQHIGMKSLSAIDEDTKAATKIQTLLTILPVDRNSDNTTEDQVKTASYDLSEADTGQNFYEFPLVVFIDPSPLGLEIEVTFDSNVLDQQDIEYLVGRFDRALRCLSDKTDQISQIGNLSCLSEKDLQTIWSRDSDLLDQSDLCVHDVFRQQAMSSPNSMAIDGWDCKLTYKDVHELSSALAKCLAAKGVKRGTIVPILTQKSGWVAVAALGVMKIGATVLGLNLNLPRNYLESILRSVNADLVLTTNESAGFCQDFVKTVLIIENEAQHPRDPSNLPDVAFTVDSSLPALILFTSGSTGKPKGVTLHHSALTSAIKLQASSAGFDSATRTFEFAAYNFDVSWNAIFKTLATGGCLCVPTEHDRNNDLLGALNNTRATLVELSSSVARLLDPADLPYLKTLTLSAEPVNLQEFEKWKPQKRIIVTYGPSECTNMATINPGISDTAVNDGIGKGLGAKIWLVDPHNHHKLTPVGSVGEILIEGPILGLGYLHDALKTSEMFVKDPVWLSIGYDNHPGRHSQLYKTSDLARFDHNGNLHFVGRKDTQIKLRGQRIELEEIEHWIRSSSQAHLFGIAMALPPRADPTHPILVAVIAESPVTSSICNAIVPTQNTTDLVSEAHHKLKIGLPSYMIPSAYIFVDRIPHNTNNKIDRNRLRVIAKAVPENIWYRPEVLRNITKRAPSNAHEAKLQQLWAQVLGLAPEGIGGDDDFFSLNGDSLSAMQLVALLKKDDLSMSVADVFQAPKLSQQAQRLSSTSSQERRSILASRTTALNEEDDAVQKALKQEAARKCGLSEDTLVEDIYPCTALQENMMAATIKDGKAFVSTTVYSIASNVDVRIFKRAWALVVRRNPILRTRIIDCKDHGLMQCVLKSELAWEEYSNLPECTDKFEKLHAGLGVQLGHWAIVRDIQSPNNAQFVWSIHHAIYDGWTLKLLDTQLKQAYFDPGNVDYSQGLKPIIQYLEKEQMAGAPEFWASYLKEAGEESVFPRMPSVTYEPRSQSFMQKKLAVNFNFKLAGVSMTTVLYAGWSLLVSKLTGSSCAIFGAILAGRNIPVDGIDKIFGPTITTVPLCVELDGQESLSSLLSSIQNKSVQMIQHEQYGIRKIRRLNEGARSACNFQTVLVIQPRQSQSSSNDLSRDEYDELMHLAETNSNDAIRDEMASLNQYGLMLEIIPETQNITVRASFDRNMIAQAETERLLYQLEHVLKQLMSVVESKSADCSLTAFDYTAGQDLDKIAMWNKLLPESVQSSISAALAPVISANLEKPAIHAWDGQICYRELEELSSQLCFQLNAEGFGKGDQIPLLFNKSMWTSVAMLAVVKSGAAFVPLDPSHPEGRLRAIMQGIKARCILCSISNLDLATRLVSRAIMIDGSSLQQNSTKEDTYVSKKSPIVSSTDIAYTIFTSGSTGNPKSFQITHANLCAAMRHQAATIGFNMTTRAFDSSSYAFDACIFNLFYTLSQGGCLCVPSEQDRVGNIEQSIQDFGVTLAQLTPSIARILDPKKVSRTVTTLVLTGEPLTRDDIQRWANYVKIINVYGPSECTIMCSGATNITKTDHARSIGYGLGANLWLCDVDDPTKLAMLGVVGEILIEGPLLGAGYLHDAEQTDQTLVKNPEWLVNGLHGRFTGRRSSLFRTGDLARYEQDGSLTYVGRKGAEIKLRGQRVDIAGIESSIREYLPPYAEVAVHITKPGDVSGQQKQMLLSFVCLNTSEAEKKSTTTRSQLAELMSPLEKRLSEVLPTYLKPEAYIQLPKMPKTSSGKIDRRQLSRSLSTIKSDQLIWADQNSVQDSTRKPGTNMEVKLADLWSCVINIDSSTINATDNFFKLGGDSIMVMHLVTLAQENGLKITAGDVFKNAQLASLAKVLDSAGTIHDIAIDDYAAFSLLKDTRDSAMDAGELIEIAQKELEISRVNIEDITPANAFQIGCFDQEDEPLGLQYVHIDLPPSISWESLVQACNVVVNQTEAMRSRFMKYNNSYYQVILKEIEVPVEQYTTRGDMTTYTNEISHQDARKAQLTENFTKLMLLKAANKEARRVILRVSHTQYDGFSIGKVLVAITAAYNTGEIIQMPKFSHLLHWRSLRKSAAIRYWRQLLEGSSSSTPALTFKPVGKTGQIRTLRTVSIPNFHTADNNRISRPLVILNVAWSIVMAHLMSTSDVVIGNVTTGRNEGMPRTHDVVGPCVNMVPMRLQIDETLLEPTIIIKDNKCPLSAKQNKAIMALVHASAEQIDSRLPYEGAEWQDIAKALSWPATDTCQTSVHFRNMEFSPPLKFRCTPSGSGNDQDEFENLHPTWVDTIVKPRWMTLLTHPEEGELRLWIYADPAKIGDDGADELLRMLCRVIEVVLEAMHSSEESE